jgi:hypothetical protein
MGMDAEEEARLRRVRERQQEMHAQRAARAAEEKARVCMAVMLYSGCAVGVGDRHEMNALGRCAALQMDAEKRAHKVEEHDKMTGRSTGYRLGDVCQHITSMSCCNMHIYSIPSHLQGKDSPPKKSPAPSRLRNDSMCGRQKSSTAASCYLQCSPARSTLDQMHPVNHAQQQMPAQAQCHCPGLVAHLASGPRGTRGGPREDNSTTTCDAVVDIWTEAHRECTHRTKLQLLSAFFLADVVDKGLESCGSRMKAVLCDRCRTVHIWVLSAHNGRHKVPYSGTGHQPKRAHSEVLPSGNKLAFAA